MRVEILKYLGYQQNATVDAQTESLIDRALLEVEKLSEFKYVHAFYDYPQDFMLKHQAYMDYLKGSDGYLLCATTIGIAVDRRLKRLQMEDMAYAVVFDATAGVYVEHLADEYEKKLPYNSLGFRFCPGYAGTPLEDNEKIAALVKANKIGISFLDSGLMLPMKSMTGIVRIGGESRKSCKDCVAFSACAYRKRGETCYSQPQLLTPNL
jgi:hypothetical protein